MFTQQELDHYIKDLKKDNESPTYETPELDLIMNVWTDNFEPAEVLKEHGYYDKLKALVKKTTISGVLFRGVESLPERNIIDYSNELTQWHTDFKSASNQTDPDNPYVLKCTFENMKGMKVINREDNERIIDETKFEIIDKDSDVINVRVVN